MRWRSRSVVLEHGGADRVRHRVERTGRRPCERHPAKQWRPNSRGRPGAACVSTRHATLFIGDPAHGEIDLGNYLRGQHWVAAQEEFDGPDQTLYCVVDFSTGSRCRGTPPPTPRPSPHRDQLLASGHDPELSPWSCRATCTSTRAHLVVKLHRHLRRIGRMSPVQGEVGRKTRVGERWASTIRC